MFYRLGLAMVRRRWLVLGVWLLALAIALPFAPRITSVLQSGGFSSPDMQSQQAVDLLVQKLHYQLNAVQILFSSPTMTADDPRFIQEADATLAGLSGWSEVSEIVPFTENPHQISRDGHTAYTVVLLKGDPDSAPQQLPTLEGKLGHPQDVTVQVGGGPVFYADIQSVSEAGSAPGGATGLPICAAGAAARLPLGGRRWAARRRRRMQRRRLAGAALPAGQRHPRLDLRAEHHHALWPRPRRGLLALHGQPLPRGTGAGRQSPRPLAARWPPPDVRSSSRAGRLDWSAGAGDSAAEHAALRWHRRHADRRAVDSGGGDAAARAVEHRWASG